MHARARFKDMVFNFASHHRSRKLCAPDVAVVHFPNSFIVAHIWGECKTYRHGKIVIGVSAYIINFQNFHLPNRNPFGSEILPFAFFSCGNRRRPLFSLISRRLFNYTVPSGSIKLGALVIFNSA